MTEDTRDILCDAIEDAAGPQWIRYYVRHLLWEVFNKYGEVEVPVVLGGNMNYSQEQIDAHDADCALRRQIAKMLDDRDRDALEWLGRNIPSPHDKEPEDDPVKYQVADYMAGCLDGLPGDWYFPKRAEVAEKVKTSKRRVEEFYKEVARASGLDLDERRPKANVWA